MRLVGPPLAPLRAPTIARSMHDAARSAHGLYMVEPRGEDTFFSYASIHEDARRVAASLAALGVRPGQRVALSLPTGREFFASFFGVQYAGAVPIPIAPPSHLCKTGERLRQIAGMLVSATAAALVTNEAMRSTLATAARAAPSCRHCVTADELMSGSDQLELETLPTALGVIQFSSGSTSDPKPVGLSHANLISQVAALEQLMGPGGTGVSWLPMYHDMGLIGALLSAVYQARPLALMAPETFLTRPGSWLRAITRYRATVSPAPNFAFRQCLLRVRDAELAELDLSSWRIALCGGEAVSAPVMRQFLERFGPVGFDASALSPAYGLAESSLAVATAIDRPLRIEQFDARTLAAEGRAVAPIDCPREIVSVGTPAPGAEIEIRDVDGHVLGEGQVGRVHTRGPSVMTGYFANPEATAEALRGDGWLYTGDLGFIHGGELFISGRAKDVVIIRGSNHSPQEFEDCLADVEGLRSGFAAIAAGFVPPGGVDEELLVLVERGVDAPADLPRRITNAILDRTGIRPHTVLVVERGSLPRTTSGKLRRVEALRRYLAGEIRLAPTLAGAVSVA